MLKGNMKTKARIRFNNTSEETLEDFARFLRQTTFFAGVHIELDSLVEVTFNPIDWMKSQCHWLNLALSNYQNWEFVGPQCPHNNEVQHDSHKRNLSSMKHPTKGDHWVCLDFRCKRRNGDRASSIDTVAIPRSPNDELMDYRDFGLLSRLMAMQPDPVPLLKQNVTGRRPLVTPTSLVKTKEEKNEVCKDLLGCNYSELEHAILFSELGIKRTDVRHIHKTQSCLEAGMHLDGGGVLLVNPDSEPTRVANALEVWSQKNHPGGTVSLAIVEVDRQNLNGDIFAKEAVKKAVDEFGNIRQRTKSHSFLLQEEFSSKVSKDSDSPYAQKAARTAYDHVTKLTVENERLRDDIKDSDATNDTLRKLNRELSSELDKRVKELADWDAAKLMPTELPKAIDEMLRFMAGLNLQDQSIADQRTFLEKFSKLKKAYDAIPNVEQEDDKVRKN